MQSPQAGDELRPEGTTGRGLGASGSAAGTSGEANPRLIDQRADRTTFIVYGVMITAFLVVGILSAMTEASRGSSVDPARVAMWDGTSVFVILLLMPLAARFTDHATPGEQSWPRVLAVHAVGVAAFSLLHIAGMVLLRKIGSPIAFHEPYVFSDNLPREIVYEFRKDAMSYTLLVMLLVLGRELAQKNTQLERAKARAAPQVLTYRSGGTTVVFSAADFLWAKAEGNYAEVHSALGKHFVRTTLKGLEDDLVAAGMSAVRVHRSYVVAAEAISKLVPTGNGDSKLTMRDGADVPVSRRYRENLDLG